METNNYVPEIYIGENGNWFINGSDTGQPSRGPQGKSAYEIAVTFGYRGTEAEWLSGLKGEQGSKGDKGDKGDSGDRGIKGDKGDKGDSGDKGVKGDKGDTGDKGAKGDPGATGPQGIQGPKGDKGEMDAINDQTPTYTVASSLTQLSTGERVSVAFGKIAKAVSTLISHISLKATEAVAGHVKLSRNTSVTETGAYALDAVEKNTGVSGTLANQIAKLENNVFIDLGMVNSVDNLDVNKMYKGLLSDRAGRQFVFLQIPGVFSLQVLFLNLDAIEDRVGFRIATSNTFSGISWSWLRNGGR